MHRYWFKKKRCFVLEIKTPAAGSPQDAIADGFQKMPVPTSPSNPSLESKLCAKVLLFLTKKVESPPPIGAQNFVRELWQYSEEDYCQLHQAAGSKARKGAHNDISPTLYASGTLTRGKVSLLVYLTAI